MYYSVVISSDLRLHELTNLLKPHAKGDLLYTTQLVRKPSPPTGMPRGRPPGKRLVLEGPAT